MKKEETIIHYRPELAEQLREFTETVITLYEKDPRAVLYHNLAVSYEQKYHNVEKAEALRAAEKWFADKTSWYRNSEFLVDKFEEAFPKTEKSVSFEYDVLTYTVRNDLHPEKLTEAMAARLLCESYQKLILAEKEKIDMSDFTKAEKYAVDSFFSMLLAPVKNPNIQIHEGSTKCFYDEHPYDGTFSYRKATDATIRYIKEDLDSRLYFFETPDEDLDEPQKQTM